VIAVVPVRSGTLPLGGAEAVAEAGGRAVLVGSGVAEAAAQLAGIATAVQGWETAGFQPAAWSAALTGVLHDHDVVLLPASPDGRDLAPRLAASLGRALYAPAMQVQTDRVTVIRGGGLRTEVHHPTAAYVATLQPGVRGVEVAATPGPELDLLDLDVPDTPADPRGTGLLDADPATVDLADARRIVAAGAGLGGEQWVELTERVALALGASYGATRVVTDAGWAPLRRQIGTTGVVVSPELYIALGISGAVQHVSGIGQPDTVVAVNTDASCPMMTMADLALVTDAPALLRELADRLGLSAPVPADAAAVEAPRG